MLDFSFPCLISLPLLYCVVSLSILYTIPHTEQKTWLLEGQGHISWKLMNIFYVGGVVDDITFTSFRLFIKILKKDEDVQRDNKSCLYDYQGQYPLLSYYWM